MVETLVRLFKIIDLLENSSELRLKDISDKLGIDTSTCHRYLKTLLKYNYVKMNPSNKKYSLGLKFLNISTKIIDSIDIRNIAHPHLIELGKQTNETIHLTTFDGKRVVYIDKIESSEPIRMYSRIGNIAPINCTAAGKAILAFQNSELISEIIQGLDFIPLTKNTITDKEKFLKELEKIRKSGFAIDDSEHEENICCIAAPIRDYSRKVKYAVSISAIKTRMSLSKLVTFKDILLEEANIISKELGFIEA
ncbi:MAG: IclR family transcriptional regulator [Candidatus Humimicrobiaceae bacterium]|jgi:DNA-binding IclR family transcriptional regulator|nr:IclR family transcriptional regulator [Candidatus Humimicrobiaceae bacterium]